MKILITGAKGFIGKNLIAELKNRGYTDIYEFDVDTPISALDEYCQNADFVFHLAGVNRPESEEEFMEGNFGFTSMLLETLKKHNNKSPVMLSSSIQAELDNPYGKSKKAGEDLIFEYGKETGAKVLVYRFPNVFGKWSRPNYNSAVATFCHNIARGLPIKVNDPDTSMTLVYIDDLVDELINALAGKEYKPDDYCTVKKTYNTKLGEIVDLIYSFKESRKNLFIPNMKDELTKKLYSTYLSFLPENEFSYPLKTHKNERGSFTELFKSWDRGQVSVNISKPGVTKGNHWHHTKVEKFVVVSGHGIIRFRKIDDDKIVEYKVSGDKPEVIDIPVGYTHNIENIGDGDMITIMWANEIYDPQNPGTYSMEV